VRETALRAPRSVQKEVRRCSRHWSRDSPAVRGADPGEAGCALQPMEVHSGADLHLQPMETPHQSRWMPEGVCDSMGSPRWSRLQDLWPHGARSPRWSRFAGRACDLVRDPRWSSLFLKDCTPWNGPTLEQFVENCSLWEGLTLEKFVENCLHGRDPTLQQGMSVRRKEHQTHVMN